MAPDPASSSVPQQQPSQQQPSQQQPSQQQPSQQQPSQQQPSQQQPSQQQPSQQQPSQQQPSQQKPPSEQRRLRPRLLPRLPRSLSARLTLTYTTLLAASLLVFAVIVFLLFDAGVHAQLDARLEHEAAEFAASIIIRGDDSLDFSSPLVTEHEAIIRGVSSHGIQVIARNGRVLWLAPDTTETPAAPTTRIPETMSRVSSEEEVLPDGRMRRLLYHPVFRGDHLLAWVQVSALEGVVQDAIAMLRLVLAAVAVILIGAAGAGGHALARRSLRPLKDIAAAAETITSRTLSMRIDAGRHGDQEIRTIAQALDDLLGRLEQSFTRIARFTADASHELLTPLTAIRQDLDVTLRKPRSADDYRATLERLRGDAERLTRIVRSLLALSRIDHAQPSSTVPADLALVIREESAALAARAAARRITLTTSTAGAPGPVFVAADDARLHAIVANLIENALRYTPEGGWVEVTAGREGEEVILRVRDSGAGLPPGQEARIFDRFFRGSNALESGTEGSGLGLAIAASFVETDQGRITARTHPEGGAEFTVRWPCRP